MHRIHGDYFSSSMYENWDVDRILRRARGELHGTPDYVPFTSRHMVAELRFHEPESIDPRTWSPNSQDVSLIDCSV